MLITVWKLVFYCRIAKLAAGKILPFHLVFVAEQAGLNLTRSQT